MQALRIFTVLCGGAERCLGRTAMSSQSLATIIARLFFLTAVRGAVGAEERRFFKR